MRSSLQCAPRCATQPPRSAAQCAAPSPAAARWGERAAAGPAKGSTSSPPLSRRAAPSPRGGAATTVARAGSGKGQSDLVVPPPDLRLGLTVLALGGGVTFVAENPYVGVPIGLLGLLLTIQTNRVQFQFGRDALEVRVSGEEVLSRNSFVGGKNRWTYKSFVNWEMWWPEFPILVYFKETQTRPEGQIHFFPVLFDGQKLYRTMVERCGPTKNSGRR